MKVYVVTAGEYSDRRVVGVFSDKAKADDILKHEKESYRAFNKCEEFELDQLAELFQPGLFAYEVEFKSGTMDVDVVRQVSFGEHLDNIESDWSYFHAVLARDEQHAIKIASDQQAQRIALNK